MNLNYLSDKNPSIQKGFLFQYLSALIDFIITIFEHKKENKL